MVTVPAPTAVNTPVVISIVATLILLLLQVPPGVASLNVRLFPIQIVGLPPVMPTGVVLTVKLDVV